jgi:hypothetical protein
MSAQLMALVRELKTLNARKKAGEELSADEETRRKELKAFLKTQLEGAEEAPKPAAPAAPRPPSVDMPAAVASAPPRRPPSVDIPAAPPPRPVTMSAPPPTPAPVVAPPPAAPPKFVPRKDVFAISGADMFIDAAMSSEAVAKTDPWSARRAHASDGDLAEAEAKADAAIRANRKRERVVAPDDVEAQLREARSGYTPPSDSYCLEQYYGDYFGEGLQPAAAAEAVELRPVDPRELEMRRAIDIATASTGGATSVAVPAGLAFLDDFPALYARRILQPPTAAAAVEVDDPSMLIGSRKVTVHLINGEKKQGAVRGLKRGELGFRLEAGGASEEIAISQVKAVFVHLQPNASVPTSSGRAITVMFRDQRAVQGTSPDYAPQAPVFSLVPPAGRGQFEKIIINAGAVASVS